VKASPKQAGIVAEQVRLMCRALKMPGLLKRLDELVRRADAESWAAIDVLEDALSTEIASRDASSVRLRVREARFPDLLTMDTFDFALAHGVDKAQVLALARGTFVDEKQNVVLVGPVGTGKTHLATALGIEVARQRRRVTWFRAADLVRTLIEAKGSRELGRLERRLARSKVLVLDELGFVPFDREGGARHGHGERQDRDGVNARIGDRDRSEATLSDGVQSLMAFSFRRDAPLSSMRWALWTTRSQMESATVGSLM
jgi:DNA replication protein DnaC